MNQKIKVMIVDDSASVRKVVSEIINSNSDMEVIAAVSDPIIAERYLKNGWPDVMILDIEMPRKDGITFMKEIMASRPTPIIICSSLADKNASVTLDALSSGAVDIITKPKIGIREFLTGAEMMISDAVRSAYSADIRKINPGPAAKVRAKPRVSADAVLKPGIGSGADAGGERFIAIGASAGGTRAVELILRALPGDSLPVIIVQHMPEKFTGLYATRLDGICEIRVKEAEDGDMIKRGWAFVARGNRHMMVKRRGKEYYLEIKDGPPVNRHKPSVDVLFRSISKAAGNNALGIILTGMGDDGAAGMREMHDAGVFTIAQDEETSLVFGMPKEAIRRGGVDVVLPLQKIPQSMMDFYN